MKIVLASYFEPENHGPGRKIGISPGKPKNLKESKGYECEFLYEALSPGDDYWTYQKEKKSDLDAAGKNFTAAYRTKLRQVVETIQKSANDENKSVEEIVGLQDGDTLLSWELNGHTTYRTITAEYLRELGYEVEEK